MIQRRVDGHLDFYRKWNEYKIGFGDVSSEFWLGNKYINLLSKKTCMLRIELKAYDGRKRFAEYNNFSLGAEDTNFILKIGGYLDISNAGEIHYILIYLKNGIHYFFVVQPA